MDGQRQKLKKARQGLAGGLVLAAGDAGVDISPDILLQRGPPKPLPQQRTYLSNPGMTGKLRSMAPLQHLGPQVRWNKE